MLLLTDVIAMDVLWHVTTEHPNVFTGRPMALVLCGKRLNSSCYSSIQYPRIHHYACALNFSRRNERRRRKFIIWCKYALEMQHWDGREFLVIPSCLRRVNIHLDESLERPPSGRNDESVDQVRPLMRNGTIWLFVTRVKTHGFLTAYVRSF